MTDRQIEIIDAAGKILSESGVIGLTIKNLAKEMRFSEAAIYRHFSSKEQIILGMLQYLAETLEKIYVDSYLPEDKPEDKLVQLFKDKFQFFKNHPHFAVVVFSDGLMESSEKINKAIHLLMKIKSKHITSIVRENQSTENFIQTLSEEEIIHLIMGAIRLQMFKWRVSNFEFDIVETGVLRLKNILTLIKTK
jgi:TetR/AcrR family fatty acid metabolism transcriptional regulator